MAKKIKKINVASDKKGTVKNPYTVEEHEQMLAAGQWTGGYVENIAYAEGEMNNGNNPEGSFYYEFDDPFEIELINSLTAKQREFFFSYGIGIEHFYEPKGSTSQYKANENKIYINDAKHDYILQDGTIFKRELLHAKQEALGMDNNHSCREFQEHVVGDILYTQRDGIMPLSVTINRDDPNYQNYTSLIENSANGINNVIVFANMISSYYNAFCDKYSDTPKYQTSKRNYYYDYNWITILDFFDL